MQPPLGTSTLARCTSLAGVRFILLEGAALSRDCATLVQLPPLAAGAEVEATGVCGISFAGGVGIQVMITPRMLDGGTGWVSFRSTGGNPSLLPEPMRSAAMAEEEEDYSAGVGAGAFTFAEREHEVEEDESDDVEDSFVDDGHELSYTVSGAVYDRL